MEKKWPEMVIKQPFMSQFHCESEYIFFWCRSCFEHSNMALENKYRKYSKEEKNWSGHTIWRNTVGIFFFFPQCEKYFLAFIDCNCSTDGSKNGNCDKDGRCSCKLGFDEDKCGICAKGFYGFPRCKGVY